MDMNPVAFLDFDIMLDNNLSVEAKGLYSTIECFYQLGENLNQIDFLKTSSDEKSIVLSAWDELRYSGYLDKFPFNNLKLQ